MCRLVLFEKRELTGTALVASSGCSLHFGRAEYLEAAALPCGGHPGDPGGARLQAAGGPGVRAVRGPRSAVRAVSSAGKKVDLVQPMGFELTQKGNPKMDTFFRPRIGAKQPTWVGCGSWFFLRAPHSKLKEADPACNLTMLSHAHPVSCFEATLFQEVLGALDFDLTPGCRG